MIRKNGNKGSGPGDANLAKRKCGRPQFFTGKLLARPLFFRKKGTFGCGGLRV